MKTENTDQSEIVELIGYEFVRPRDDFWQIYDWSKYAVITGRCNQDLLLAVRERFQSADGMTGGARLRLVKRDELRDDYVL